VFGLDFPTEWAEPRAGGTPTPGAPAPSVAAPLRAQNSYIYIQLYAYFPALSADPF